MAREVRELREVSVLPECELEGLQQLHTYAGRKKMSEKQLEFKCPYCGKEHRKPVSEFKGIELYRCGDMYSVNGCVKMFVLEWDAALKIKVKRIEGESGK
jgi:predicted RNA-binding Zn-ribbon protein involved in translation (DUF1610 family)